jgi:hypothetical protein
MGCCTIKDIFYFVRDNGFELKLEHTRYYLKHFEADGTVQRTKIVGKNVYYLTRRKEDIDSILRQTKEQIVKFLSKGLLFHSVEIINEIRRLFQIGRGVIYVVLKQLAIEGKVSYVFGLSYRGTNFRLYFDPKNKEEIKKQIIRIKKYVLIKRLVFPNEKAVSELVSFDENGAWRDLEMLHLDVQDFKNILFHLSYLGEINQVYFIQGYPFAVPGHASELQNMINKKID